MFNIIISLIVIGVLCVAAYYAVIHIIKLWSGCDAVEAATKLHNAINGTINYCFENDEGFWNEVWHIIRSVIGEHRFKQLVNILNIANSMNSLPPCGHHSGLPNVVFSLPYADEAEKHLLEKLLTELVRKYLKMYGHYSQVLVDWRERYDLQMPVLEIRYAKTKEQRRILDECLRYNVQNSILQNSNITDDTDDEALDE